MVESVMRLQCHSFSEKKVDSQKKMYNLNAAFMWITQSK